MIFVFLSLLQVEFLDLDGWATIFLGASSRKRCVFFWGEAGGRWGT